MLKTSVSSAGKAGIDISKCKLERKTGAPGSAGSTEADKKAAYSEAVYTEQTVSTHLHWLSVKFRDYCLLHDENK